jgi:hypothetical protein
MELEGCRICELFGGPHAEHSGWNGTRVSRMSASMPRWEEVRRRHQIEQHYQEIREGVLEIPETLTYGDRESDTFEADFIEAMSHPVTGAVVGGHWGPEPSVWDPTGSHKAQGLFQPIDDGFRDRLDDDRARALAEETPIVAPGWVYAPQAERGQVPYEPTTDEVDELLRNALAFAYVGQTVRLTVVDRGTGERAAFSVIKRDVESYRKDRIRELESKIRRDLQEGEGQ